MAADDLAEGVRLRGDLIHRVGYGADAGVVEHEPVKKPLAHSRLLGTRHVAPVRRDDRIGVSAKKSGGGADGARADLGGRGGNIRSGGAGGARKFKGKSHGNPQWLRRRGARLGGSRAQPPRRPGSERSRRA